MERLIHLTSTTPMRQDIDRIVCTRIYESPCGPLIIGSLGDKICLCDWENSTHRLAVDRRLAQTLRTVYRPYKTAANEEAVYQLDEYFAGKRQQFSVPLLFVGTEFQKSVWEKIVQVPYGKTISYGSLAQSIGRDRAIRAVAKACAANAIAILTPCHRIVGAEGIATGYSGGEKAKSYLLKLEQKNCVTV